MAKGRRGGSEREMTKRRKEGRKEGRREGGWEMEAWNG